MGQAPVYLAWLAEVERAGVNLTSWEQSFIKSVRQQVKRGYGLNDDQIKKLEQIYAERTP